MNAKIIIVTVALVIMIAAAYVFINNKLTTSPETSENAVTNADVSQVSTLVGSEYSDMIQEQMNSLSIEQPTFVSQTQDSIASDLSQFYYS